jgi:choline-glycine betaine transporter
MKSQALNIPSKQHFAAYSAMCFTTGMAILMLFFLGFFHFLLYYLHYCQSTRRDTAKRIAFLNSAQRN